MSTTTTPAGSPDNTAWPDDRPITLEDEAEVIRSVREALELGALPWSVESAKHFDLSELLLHAMAEAGMLENAALEAGEEACLLSFLAGGLGGAPGAVRRRGEEARPGLRSAERRSAPRAPWAATSLTLA